MSKRWTLIDHTQDKEKHFDSKEPAQDNKAFLVSEGHDVELIDNGDDEDEEGEDVDAEIVDMTDGGQSIPKDPGTPAAKAADPREQTPTEPEVDESDADVILRENPIEYLRGINSDFVNTIKGTPAISKRGFRFIQVHLGVSTTSEVVATFEEPRGVIVHARAELPDGRYAEAHGEGYAKGDVDSHEFARYADTRAKNRALSDLTSSGALAESELE